MLSRLANRQRRIVLVIAPTLYECRKTLDAFGIPLSNIDEIRSVTKAHHLRGWSRGTPFIALSERDSWFATQSGRELSMVVDAFLLSGRLRIASDAELSDLRQPEFANNVCRNAAQSSGAATTILQQEPLGPRSTADYR